MRDYRYVPDAGPPCLVSEMATADIEYILWAGSVDIHDAAPGETVEAVLERLRLELDIRRLNLRET